MINEASNNDVIDIYVNKQFPTDKRSEWGSTNVKIRREQFGWSLINYGTPLCYFINGMDIFFFNDKKYSPTTSKIQGQIRSALHGKTVVVLGDLGDLIIDGLTSETQRQIIVNFFERIK